MSTSNLDWQIYRVVRDAIKEGAERIEADTVARHVGISRATVYRAAKRLGYHDLADMVRQIQSYFHNFSERDAAARTNRKIDLVAEMLVPNGGRPIFVAAAGDAEACGDYLVSRLVETGLNAFPYSPAAIRAHANDEASGMAFVLNESGISLWASCLELHAYNYRTVAMTSAVDSPVASTAMVCIALDGNKSDLNSYEPNLFAAGIISFFERVLERYLVSDLQRPHDTPWIPQKGHPIDEAISVVLMQAVRAPHG